MLGNIAQLVEQSAVNRWVAGSSPAVSVSLRVSKQALDGLKANYPQVCIVAIAPDCKSGTLETT